MRKSSSGIAIVLVIFIVALASIIVINLTYSTFLSTRMVGNVARQLQSEYILKSLVNFSAVLLQNDTTADDSFVNDIWGNFSLNPRIPNEYLGIADTSAEIYLEILPQNSYINVSALKPSAGNQTHEALHRLISLPDLLDFDGQLLQEDTYGYFRGRAFKASEVTGNLIDWQDADNTPYTAPYNGVEDQLDPELVRNSAFTDLGQVQSVPGLTSARFHALAPFIYASHSKGSDAMINANTAPEQILMAVNDGIDQKTAQSIIAARPFASANDITNVFDQNDTTVNKYISLDVSSTYFTVQAKVEYGLQRPYFVRAVIQQGSNNSPSKILEANYF